MKIILLTEPQFFELWNRLAPQHRECAEVQTERDGKLHLTGRCLFMYSLDIMVLINTETTVLAYPPDALVTLSNMNDFVQRYLS